MIEQAVLAALLAVAAVAQFRIVLAVGPLTLRAVFVVLLPAITTWVAQKVVSIADRQREADQIAGITYAVVECHRAQARWGALIQSLSLLTGIALAPTLWHVPVALYVGLYSVAWRPAYRRWIRPL